MKNSGDSNTKTTLLYHTIQKRKLLVLVTLFIILVLVSILAVGIGSVYIPPGDVLAVFGHALFPGSIASPDDGMADLIVMNYRLPRILLAILAGVALATAGAVMQGLLRNPLVSPFTLGLSSAASFGAALIIVLGPAIFGSIFAGSILLAGVTFSVKSVFLILSAFLFGWLSVILVYLISRTKHTSQAIMILAGVVIGYLFQAGLLGLKYVSNDDALRDAEQPTEVLQARGVGIHAHPHRAQTLGVQGQKQVLRGRGAVQGPVAGIFLQGRVGADQDGRLGLPGHGRVGVEIGHAVQGRMPGHEHEMPGLGVACAGGGHGCAKRGLDLGRVHRRGAECADGAAGHEAVQGVHAVLLGGGVGACDHTRPWPRP